MSDGPQIIDPLVRGTLSAVAQQLTQQLRPHRLGFALTMFRLDDLMTSGKDDKVPHALIATNAKLTEALAVLSSWVDTERAKNKERVTKAEAKTNGTGVAPHRRFELRVAVIDTERGGVVSDRTLDSSDVLENMARLFPRVFVSAPVSLDVDEPPVVES